MPSAPVEAAWKSDKLLALNYLARFLPTRFPLLRLFRSMVFPVFWGRNFTVTTPGATVTTATRLHDYYRSGIVISRMEMALGEILCEKVSWRNVVSCADVADAKLTYRGWSPELVEVDVVVVVGEKAVILVNLFWK